MLSIVLVAEFLVTTSKAADAFGALPLNIEVCLAAIYFTSTWITNGGIYKLSSLNLSAIQIVFGRVGGLSVAIAGEAHGPLDQSLLLEHIGVLAAAHGWLGVHEVTTRGAEVQSNVVGQPTVEAMASVDSGVTDWHSLLGREGLVLEWLGF